MSHSVMPCANVHLMLAGRVLDGWRETPSTAPFRIDDPILRSAFLTGVMAPDAGFLPGGERRFSEFAHYVAPGDLSRALLTSARSGAERAFAWGWGAHVLGDVLFHPLVGRAVGERLHGDRSRRVDAADDVTTHVSLEVGLDMQVLEAEGTRIPAAPKQSWVDRRGARHLAGVFGTTYGVPWSPDRLAADQRQGAMIMRLWSPALHIVRRGGANGFTSRIFGVMADRAGDGSAAKGFFRADPPPRWVLDELLEGAEGFVSDFQKTVDDGLTSLGNRNLETGEETPPGSGHPATDVAWRRLETERVAGIGR